jgi:hypothetical protein
LNIAPLDGHLGRWIVRVLMRISEEWLERGQHFTFTQLPVSPSPYKCIVLHVLKRGKKEQANETSARDFVRAMSPYIPILVNRGGAGGAACL